MRNREGWEVKKLEEVCDVLNGFAFKSYKYVDSGIRVIRITNVQKGVIVDESPQFYPLESMSELSKFMLKEDDLLLSLTGNVGRVGLLQKYLLPAALNQRVACLRIRNEEFLSKRFLFQFLNSDFFEDLCIRSAKGIAQKNLSTKWLSDFTLPIPPLPTQHQIVAELDTLNSIIDKKKEQLNELDNLAQATFYDMFGDPVENEKGWEKVPFNKVMTLKRGYDLPIQDRIDGNVPIMASNGVLGYHNIHKVEGPGVVTGRSGTLGLVHYVQNDYWPLNTALYVQKMNGNNPIYLLYLLKTFDLKRFSRGAGVPTLNRNLVHAEKVIETPLRLQTQFAEKIKHIEKQKALIQRSIDDVQQLFDYTMDKYFN